MTLIAGLRVCGKRANFDFRNAVRPLLASGECPTGHQVCGMSEMESVATIDLENVICIKNSANPVTDCPITHI